MMPKEADCWRLPMPVLFIKYSAILLKSTQISNKINMDIRQVNNEKNGHFEAFDSESVAGRMFYVWAGDHKFIIDHTEVNEAFAGQGVGKKLVMKAVDYAR